MKILLMGEVPEAKNVRCCLIIIFFWKGTNSNHLVNRLENGITIFSIKG